MIYCHRILIVWGVLVLCGCSNRLPDQVQAAYDNLPAQVDFNFQVKPILSDKCFACHGPDQQSLQADLRLDLPDNSMEADELVKRILSDDPELRMPPPESHLSLSETEMATLVKWIDQGAEYKPHWAFIKPEKNDIPGVNQDSWPQTPVDNFTLQVMESQGLKPSPAAPKSILARRLFFNLTGLPPSLNDLKDFFQDDTPKAYEKLVDKLLDSPAYGERMAMEWMDVARYADSDGYLDDKHRDFSPWRDWVIEAFNQNMPYDQFVTWQLAGDLVPDRTQASILATAFNRLHRKNSEAGIVFEEFRSEYVADRTNTMGKAFLGLSVECARCHDHKYDPVSQKDYYQLYAFFNSTDELGTAIYGPDQTPGPALLLTSEEQEELLEYLNAGIEQKEQQLEQVIASTGGQAQSWMADQERVLDALNSNQKQGLAVYYSFDQLQPGDHPQAFLDANRAGGEPVSISEPDLGEGYRGKAVFLKDYTRLKFPEKLGWFERTDPFTISLALYPDSLYADAGIFYHCEDFRLGLKGYSLYLDQNHLRFVISHSWPQNAIQVRTKQPLKVKEWTHITITYDGSSQAQGVNVYLNGERVPVSVDYDQLYKGILYEPNIHTYGFNGFAMGLRDKMKLFKHGGLDELKIFNRELSALEVLYDFDPKVATELVQQSRVPGNMLVEYYQRYFNPAVQVLRSQLESERSKLNNTINGIPEIMVLGDLPEARPTHVLNRGVYDAPGDPVEPGTPQAVLEFNPDFPKSRLGLSQWMFSEKNPLTARVLVNRIWQMHFGTGIVETSDDFGSQGSIPTHPELLDWLAVEFMESGWDIKHLHKTIVMSATFQQSSRATEEMLKSDPYNKWLSRGPSYRLKAEMIRDNALEVSGLLVKKLGGPSVYPYQPEGLWDEISNKVWRYKYLQEPGEGLYRRTLYTIFKRTSPPPSMLVFDVPDRSVCRVSRAHTSTPLQALVLLNDPQYIEAARVLAEKILNGGDTDLAAAMEQVFTLTTGRSPDQTELDLLQAFYGEELTRFNANREDALAYLSVGEHQLTSYQEPSKVAALATVINGIMNTNEAYTLR